MRVHSLLIGLLLIALLTSCQKEFSPVGEWEESYAAYCLLNLKDSVQYVRINRVFITPGDPSQYFQSPDSVNVDPDVIKVSMVAIKDGIPEGERIHFNPTDAFPKEEGLFSGEDYVVFRSPLLLESGMNYRMEIRNQETGYMMQAETGLLGTRTLNYSFIQTRYYNINQYKPEPVDYQGSLITSQFEKRVLRFLYYEYHGEERQMKYVDWRSPYVKSGDELAVDTGQLSDEFLKYLADNIPEVPGIRRSAVGVDKMLIINDELTTLYIDYLNYISSGEFVPELTNWDRGTGIFGSRYNYTFFAMKLKRVTVDTLACGRYTGKLGFADANGHWPPE